MISFTEDMRIIDLELFDAAFAVAPGSEDGVRRRFMTLFAATGTTLRGGSAEILRAVNTSGEVFALKRMRVREDDGRAGSWGLASEQEASGQAGGWQAGGEGAPDGERAAGYQNASDRKESGPDAPDYATQASVSRKELRHSVGGTPSPTPSGTPDYVTSGHIAVFYEEYRIHLAINNLRGFPRLFGFGLSDGNPLIIMEWVEGATLRDALRERPHSAEPLSLDTVASLGIAVIDILERAQELDAHFVHRDLSPRNIMLRSDRIDPQEQLRTKSFDLCLVDFGSATFAISPDDPTFTQLSSTWRMGTPAYAPPEMLSTDISLGSAVRQSPTIDVYALCSVLYELYGGQRPFDALVGGECSPFRVKTEDAPRPLVVREPDGGALASIIATGLNAAQQDRPSLSQLRTALENWRRMPGQQRVGGLRGAKPADRTLWTPDFVRRTITRRALISASIVGLAAAISGTLVVRKLREGQQVPLDQSRYPRASEDYAGEPLFRAYDMTLGGWALYDADGRVVCKPTSSRACGALREGMFALFDDVSQRYGYAVPSSGGDGYAWAILPVFAQAGDFSEGMAPVEDPASRAWGFANRDGSWAVDARFASVGAFSHGVAAAQTAEGDRSWGAIDAVGSWIIEPRFARLGMRDTTGCAVAQDLSGDWGIVDEGGSWTEEGRFAQLRRLSCGLAPARSEEKELWGYVDSSGSWIIEPAFLDARPFSVDGDGHPLAAVQDARSQLWYFVSTDGEPANGTEPRFWKLGDLHDGLAPAQASLSDNVVVFDEDDPSVYASGAGMRYGYVDSTETWQMRRLTNLVDTALGIPEV